MHGEESRQSRTRDYGTSKHQPDDGGTENGNAARDGCSNTESPIGILIKAQHLPAECHAQRHQQQKDADNPGKFSRELVSSKKNHLDHMNKDNGHHEIGAPAMHSADEPAESDVMVQGLQTAPCFSSRGNIDQRKENSSHDLQNEHWQCRAPKDVPPASGISWHGMFGHLANRRRKLKAVVKPVSQFRNHSHGLPLGSQSYPRLCSDASAL